MSGREELVGLLRQHVVGPRDGDVEVVPDPPNRQYLMGTLYPQQAGTGEIAANEEEDGSGGSVRDELADDPVKLANEWLPSSIGLTFYMECQDGVECAVTGARYETFREGKDRRWRRIPIAPPERPEQCVLAPPAGNRGRTRRSVLDARAELQTLWRPMGGGFLVTVTLVNVQRQAEPDKVDPDLCLQQVGLTCTPGKGRIREYPSVDVLTDDAEEEELRLLYRNARTYAIGHGCSAAWGRDAEYSVEAVWTELMPVYEVPALTHGGQADLEILSLARLANRTLPTKILIGELTAFLAGYRDWIDNLPGLHKDIPPALNPAGARLLGRLTATAEGIEEGIRLLGREPDALEAFRLANRAMLMQMRHSREDAGGRKRERGAQEIAEDYDRLSYKWRPFQLAFQLLALPSIASVEAPDRAVVDLLWFPTGGGKTEAYLSLTAFQIFLRRFRHGARAGGTAVITRYTLRLLSAQQFQRAAALICACELLRRAAPEQLGWEPITIGLWVGDEVVPNRFHKALERFEEVLAADAPENPFQVAQCPWCGTAIVPEARSEDVSAYGIRAGNSSFEFFCPTPTCPFSARLPISVIDEDLYQRPPTFLIATVDKFARLAWEEGGGAFFGGGVVDPPSLIIQDELHLLSGPLGTTVGVYEGAVASLCEYFGTAPKIIASTATIRRASDQTMGLFGAQVRVFPPPGLSAADSYFACVDRTRPGRKYVGVMSQSHTISTSIVHLGASLLQSPVDLGLTGPELDAYWTLVVYHNSLRELGRTVTLARDDIPARLKAIAADEAKTRRLGDQDVVELTSNVPGRELPSLLARLGNRVEDGDAVGLVATTSMLSVGIDIPRLGLMVVNSQPKATSEYIQATSRVGRGDLPGLIIAMYAATKPRDRSHYESFLPFHAALYRHVEPTSVTPYSLPSRQRALHAALVILIRHGVGLNANDRAGDFRASDPKVRKCLGLLLARIGRIDPSEAPAAERQLDEWVMTWQRKGEEARGNGRVLYYNAGTKQMASLLVSFGSGDDGWETLHSMRNVDRQCTIKVLGAR